MFRRFMWFIAERLYRLAIRYCRARWCKCCEWTIDGCGWGPRKHDYLCQSCEKVVLGHGYGRSPDNIHEWWCQPCIQVISKTSKTKPLVTHSIGKETYERLMREAQE